MATQSSNRSGSEEQGAFGDESKQASQGQGETKLDNDSLLNRTAGQKDPSTSQKQSSRDEAGRSDRPQD